MSHPPDRRALGHYFRLPPRWRWLYWPTLVLSGSGLTLGLYLEEGLLALGSCAPIAALPGMAGLLYWFDRQIFKAT